MKKLIILSQLLLLTIILLTGCGEEKHDISASDSETNQTIDLDFNMPTPYQKFIGPIEDRAAKKAMCDLDDDGDAHCPTEVFIECINHNGDNPSAEWSVTFGTYYIGTDSELHFAMQTINNFMPGANGWITLPTSPLKESLLSQCPGDLSHFIQTESYTSFLVTNHYTMVIYVRSNGYMTEYHITGSDCVEDPIHITQLPGGPEAIFGYSSMAFNEDCSNWGSWATNTFGPGEYAPRPQICDTDPDPLCNTFFP